jgi:peroxiredoxin
MRSPTPIYSFFAFYRPWTGGELKWTRACLGFLAFLFMLDLAPIFSQEPPKTAAQTPAEANAWIPIEVPETKDGEQLSLFIDAIKKRQPVTIEQYVEMQRALRITSKRLVDSISDRASPLFKKGESEFVNASVMLLGNEGPDAQRKTFERLRDYLKDRPKIEFVDIQMAILAGNNLEQLSDYTLAKEAYASFAEIFRSKKEPSLDAVVSLLEANGRRLDLPGQIFKLSGNTIDGEDFDLESLRGKYVLIYFWSSETRACEQEHPYMLSVYNKYQEKGFAIVGIGLDEKKDAANAFIKRLEIPWVNLWESRKNGVSKVMETYGLSAIPSSFFIDPDGKVITIEARGLLLGRALEKVFPEPAKEADPTK